MSFVILDDWGRYWGGVNWHYCNKYAAKLYSSDRGAKIAMTKIATKYPGKTLHIEQI